MNTGRLKQMKRGGNVGTSDDVRCGRASAVAALLGLLLPAACPPALAAGAHADTKPAPAPAARHHDVCPPFYLLDENGQVINPVAGVNADRPYSPKRTCGKCHDYDKITRGYHFQQGRGEKPTADQAARCLWASTPGNYGGTWCSPAPLYLYLSPKHNATARTMDMTSFTFLSIGCGQCHPGGGSAEYDRDGKRYDRWMSDPASGFRDGAENRLDGDYYKARWSQSGVLEADCLLCHMPEYDYKLRASQVAAMNFRWAPTAGAGFAEVTGSVKDNQPVKVAYRKDIFDADGRIEPHIVREPRNEACLSCHAKPGWKKRGANFRPRTDVHLRAGLKCVDCHPAGQSAEDSRIRGWEMHEIAKGDDPGGCVRNDLDDTMRTCADCHASGYLGAPIAKHRWLPPLHLAKIACQTCHIPQRAVKAALVQAGDVFNPGAKIPTKGKHLWTFYGPDGSYWNHYGDLEMMGYDDKPTDPYRPTLVRYKGKIYPANRVHSAWPAIEVAGKTALMQPKMGDIYKMWVAHEKDPARYPQLSLITDDNGDGIPEVNRPAEIDALIAAVTEILKSTDYPMQGKRVLWVMDDRAYSSGTEFRTLPKHPWEASPYANVHTYNHDVYPADAALGAGGCTDCHRPGSWVFFSPVLKYRFDADCKPVTVPQYSLLGIGRTWALIGAWREGYLKPALYALLAALLCTAGGLLARAIVGCLLPRSGGPTRAAVALIVTAALAAAATAIARRDDLLAYMLPSRFALDANHFLVAVAVMLLGLGAMAGEVHRRRIARGGRAGPPVIAALLGLLLLAAGVAGTVMLLKPVFLPNLTRASYTAFDAALSLVLALTLLAALKWVVLGFARPHSGEAAPGGGQTPAGP
ncbi:MAG: hypothetical protein J7M21_05135 [Planctomycetes bacterium]|nr:hypothetical protein [Planctomycetota bacterium]